MGELISTPLNLLVVDDSRTDLHLIRRALKHSAHNVSLSTAQNGLQALAHLRHPDTHTDLILLDLNMPHMDGLEVLRIIKNDAQLCGLPVVILTTSGAQKDVAEAYRLRANSYIQKPMRFSDFIHVVQDVIHFWNNVADPLPQA